MAALKDGATLKAAVALMVVTVCMSRVAEATNSLYQGYFLSTGTELTNGVFRFAMQSDCNLVLYKNSQQLWSTGTEGRGDRCFFVMQDDGNAVLYVSDQVQFHGQGFQTNTADRGDGMHHIILQDDGNVVMFNGNNRAIWQTNTGGRKLQLVDAGLTDPTHATLVFES